MSNRENSTLLWLFGMLLLLSSTLFGASQYEEKVNIPKYNPNDSTHVLITPSNGKWSSAVLNSTKYKHFYVKPGKYHTRVNLTQSGTKQERRTLSLYNSNDIHPAALPLNQVADIRLNLMGASYWTLDRLSNINDKTRPSFYLHNGATHNILNRLHLKNFYYGIIITNLSHNNSIQNSYFDHMTHQGRYSDSVGIAIYSDKVSGGGKIYNTRIVNNDIRNSGDGIQLVKRSQNKDLNSEDYQGTIIDTNMIWFDGDAYTNGSYATQGYSKNGKYMIGENAMDIKSGSKNRANPVVITNNIMWGYLERDKSVGGAFSIGSGKVIIGHQGAKNVKMHNNIIFDSQIAFASGEIENWEIKNNIIANMNTVNPLDKTTYAAYFYKSKSIKVENNTFKNIPQSSRAGGYFFRFDSKTTESTFRKNIIINAKGTSPNYGNIMGENLLYQSKVNYGGANDKQLTAAEIKSMKDYTFFYKRFTAKKETKTLQGIILPETSSHYGETGSSRTGEMIYGASTLSSRPLATIISYSIF